VEYGIESTSDRTLLRINRGHDYACAVDAVKRTAARGIPVGAHIILGLPGESREELMQQAAMLSELPLTTLKLHQLQLIRGTRMAEEYIENPADFSLFSVEDYIETVVDYVERLNPDIVLERFASQSPKELLIAPDWGLKNHELIEKVKRRMRERDTWQGKKYIEDKI
jgi:radical SAM protein (TIGR01212 family)